MRSGDEPTHARSALRPRMWLAGFGFVDAVAGVIVFSLLGSLPFVLVSAVLGVVSGVNLIVVGRHIRQGPHYQPGRAIPPYRPVDDGGFTQRREPRPPTPGRTRRRRYFVMMGTCFILITLAWTWIKYYSLMAAELMTLVAALIPPFAAIITNADSPILRDGGGPDPDGEDGVDGAAADASRGNEDDPEHDPGR
ncbi:MAG TPA: DUF6343 family protein [Actinocrinis sp.]|nr:DUF6343 family protein [Actinocrinis sp.]